jgi:hypothetical protein
MRTTAAVVAAFLAGTSLAAQQPPRRPRLARDADTNDAVAYFRWGLSHLEAQPALAAAAFHWAARLDPASPQTLYAEGTALLLTNTDRLVRYMQEDASLRREPDIQRVDSLFREASIRDPLLETGLDEMILIHYLRGVFARQRTFTGNEIGDATIVHSLDTALAQSAPALRARLSASRRNYSEALGYLNRAVREARRGPVANLHRARALAFWHLGQLDSAEAALRVAIDAAGREDSALFSPAPPSKALLAHTMGRVLEQKGDLAGARAAYEQALVEDVSHFPSHVRLALIALQLRDTSRALDELESAVGIKEDDYLSVAMLGAVLGRSGRHREAIERLTAATVIEPWAAAGWLLLAREKEATVDVIGAIQAYERFLALATGADPARDAVVRRLARLRE